MKKLAVIHYMPLEYYPPVTNFLNVVSTSGFRKIKAWSTKNIKNRKEYSNEKIAVARSPFPKPGNNAPLRLIKYCIFNIKTLIGLLLFKPDLILYYDSFSAWPVYMYYKLTQSKTALYIHYHEYFSLNWYKNSMILVNKYHQMENRTLYSKAEWISQTNKDRLNLFLKDHPNVDSKKLYTLANYPPEKWSKLTKDYPTKENTVLKTVYIGSLSLKTTYIKEYCEWVIEQKGSVIFDIYAYNLHVDTQIYLKNINTPYIRFFNQGIEYENIPEVLSGYDVGLILYKATTDNYKYNAPNKLFEYLSCNLVVWYSDKMMGIKPYTADNIIAINFEAFNVPSLPSKTISENNYTAEKELSGLLQKMIN